MKGVFRVLKSSFWYSVVMLAGYGYLTHSPLPDYWYWLGFVGLSTVLYLAISKARQILRF